MSKFSISTKAFQRKLKAKERALEREAAGALGEAATELEKDIKSRVFPVKHVSRQDAPGGTVINLAGRSPVATTINRSQGTAVVRVSRHWTTARTAGVRNTFQSVGLGAKLERRGLYIGGNFVLFSRDPGLKKWAHRPEKGNQYLRHVVRLSEPQVIGRMMVRPGAREAFPKVTKIWLRATRRAFRT
ncbi:MAG: hypothetical protein ACH37Z_15105 [Anaerolineae bacterium]